MLIGHHEGSKGLGVTTLVAFSGKDWSSQHRRGLQGLSYGAFWLSGAGRSGFIMPSLRCHNPTIPSPKTTKPRQGGVLFMCYLQRSNVEAEVHHVAVLDDVVLAFQAPFAGFLGAGFALVGDKSPTAHREAETAKAHRG